MAPCVWRHRVTTTILVVDDHALMRSGLAAIIAQHADLQVVAEAENGARAVEQFLLHRPQVTLMDLRMPVMDGVEATMIIRRQFPEARILIVSTHGRDEGIAAALRAGASGYIDKKLVRTDLVGAIRSLRSGVQYFGDDLR